MDVAVSTRWQGSTCTVVVSGEVDLATGPAVVDAITEAVATPGASAVEVDLSGVGFLDSSGIAALLKGRRHADGHQVAYRVTGAQGVARRVLEMAGVWTHLTGEAGTAQPTRT